MDTLAINRGEKNQGVPWSFFFWLRDSRLLSEEQLERLQQNLPAMNMRSLSAQLVDDGWLTPYQLRRIREGETRGLILGQYRVLDELGEGGFGKVYKAVHRLMNRVAALKVIAPKWVQNRGARDLLLREVVATTRLTHPNIAMAYDANETDDILWFAMEYVAGMNLHQFVETRGPLPIPLACDIIHQVARALQYAHEHGMVHRDIKPANLLIPESPSDSEHALSLLGSPLAPVKVVDFGLARLLPTASQPLFTLCQEGVLLGTPSYISPEQARNGHLVDIRADLYSLGCTFYFALTGRDPFKGVTTVQIIAQQLEQEAEPLSKLRAEVPSNVAEIVRRLMAKNPEHRFQTPAELMESLSFALTPSSWSATSISDSPAEQSLDPCPQREAIPPSSALGAREIVPHHEDGPPIPESPPDRTGAVEADAPIATRCSRGGQSPSLESEVGTLAIPPAETRTEDPILPLWRKWLTFVETYARGTPSPKSESQYRQIHVSLMAALNAQVSSSANPRSSLYVQMQSLVEPWLTPRALAELDRITLIGLWESCGELDAEVFPPVGTPRGVWLFFGLLAMGALFAFILAYYNSIPR